VARKTFRYSIAYLAFVFAALLFDHYLHAAFETSLRAADRHRDPVGGRPVSSDLACPRDDNPSRGVRPRHAGPRSVRAPDFGQTTFVKAVCRMSPLRCTGFGLAGRRRNE